MLEIFRCQITAEQIVSFFRDPDKREEKELL